MHLSKTGFIFISIALIAMLAALPFLLPSGEILSRAQQNYRETLWEEDEEETAGAHIQPIALIAAAAASDVIPSSHSISSLPVDNSPGNTPIEANFTATGYQDDSITVQMEQRHLFESDLYIAHVQIATPSQLRTATAGGKINSTRTNKTSVIAQNYNAIVAINGDMYAENAKAGFIYRQGETYMEKPANGIDVLQIDEEGNFHIFLRGKESQHDAMREYKANHKTINGFFFGPALIQDSKVLEIPDDYQWNPFRKEPRSAIGQTGPLSYVLVSVNGRTNTSEGVTLPELAEIMNALGCIHAYNLDGGNSATLVFHGEVYNDKPQDERSVADILYFATAAQEK